MHFDALELRFVVAGLGVILRTRYRFDSLKAAFGDWEAVGSDWKDGFDNPRLRQRFSRRTAGFKGWILGGEHVALPNYVIYENVDHLANALNARELEPVGGDEELDRWGLRYKGRVAKTRLTESRDLLFSLGLLPTSALRSAGLVEVLPMKAKKEPPAIWFENGEDASALSTSSPAPENKTYLKKLGELGFAGYAKAVCVPVDVRLKAGLRLRRARWVAQFPRPKPRRFPKPARLGGGRVPAPRGRFPFMYFDGKSAKLVPTLDEVPQQVKNDLERSGEYSALRWEELLPPLSLAALYVVRAAEIKTRTPDELEEPKEAQPSVAVPRGLVAVSGHAAVRLSANLTRLGGAAAIAAWEASSSGADFDPDSLEADSDIFLCQRMLPPSSGWFPDNKVFRQLCFWEG